jgi:ZIP family zinc transporter
VLIAFAVLPFFSTLLGGWAAIRLRHRLHPIMAFAAGVLVATALADLLPEATDLIGTGANPVLPGAAAVLGFLLFSGLDAFVHRRAWEHEHERLTSPKLEPSEPHEHSHAPVAGSSPLGLLGPMSLIVHSTLDGLAIGLGFRAGLDIGLLVGLAVLAHDFADGMNVVTLSLSVLGVLGFLLAAFSGVFLAVGAGHLLPEAQHGRPSASPPLVLLTALGAALVLTVRSILG